jgi:hypothetical protein
MSESHRDRIRRWLHSDADVPRTPEEKERDRVARAEFEHEARVHFQDTSEEALLYLAGEKEAIAQTAAENSAIRFDAGDHTYELRVNDADIHAIEQLREDALALSLTDPGDDRVSRVQELLNRAAVLLGEMTVDVERAWRGDELGLGAVIGKLSWQMTPKLFAVAYARRHALPRRDAR